jgi:antitoxin MazE
LATPGRFRPLESYSGRGSGMKEGDQIEMRIAGPREFEITRDRSRVAAIERLRKLRRRLPSGFTYDRVDANER